MIKKKAFNFGLGFWILIFVGGLSLLFTSFYLIKSQKPKDIRGKIAYTNHKDIYIFNFGSLKNKKIYSLTEQERKDFGSISGLSWSPDGTKIVFSKKNAMLSFDSLYIIDNRGIEQKRVMRNGLFMLCPSWSPDGRKIAFAAQGINVQGIYILNLSDLSINRICNLYPEEIEPAWSPDSSKIAFTIEKTETQNGRLYYNKLICLTDVNGKSSEELVKGLRPLWLSNTKIIYLNENSFEFIDIVNKKSTKLFTMPKFSRFVDSVSISNDRRYLIYHTFTPGIMLFNKEGFSIIDLKEPKIKYEFNFYPSQIVYSMSWNEN